MSIGRRLNRIFEVALRDQYDARTLAGHRGFPTPELPGRRLAQRGRRWFDPAFPMGKCTGTHGLAGGDFFHRGPVVPLGVAPSGGFVWAAGLGSSASLTDGRIGLISYLHLIDRLPTFILNLIQDERTALTASKSSTKLMTMVGPGVRVG